jgi:putative DNA primase/helicase
VEGCLEWQREGLPEPEEVRSATESYKEEMDPLARFIEECCVFSSDLRTPAKDLTVAYRIWVRENGEQELPWREVISKLKTHGCESSRTNTERGWIGIGLTKEGEQMARRAALLF